MNISQRLLAMLAIALAALLVLAGFGTYKLRVDARSFTELDANIIPSLVVINSLDHAINENRIALYAHILAPNDQQKSEITQQIAERNKSIEQLFAQYEQLGLSEEERTLFAGLKESHAAYQAVAQQVIQRSTNRDQTGAYALADGMSSSLYRKLGVALGKEIDFNRQHSNASVEESVASANRAVMLFIGVALAAMVVVAALGVWILRAIRGPLQRSLQALSHIESELDFTRRIPAAGKDEIGELVGAFNRLLDTVQKSFRTINEHIVQMTHAAHTMAETSHGLSGVANNASEASAHMAATVEEVTVSISHVAERARDAEQHAQSSGHQAAEGEQVIQASVSEINSISGSVNQAADEINALREQSQQIHTVLGVIKDIADQTNLLALNAAIEAARAGEQGRGFAVVADEVRKLAERTSNSTFEITHTVQQIQDGANRAVTRMNQVVESVEQGVGYARDAGEEIGLIRHASENVVQYVSDISESIAEQSMASTAIAQQVEHIAQMAEETSSAARKAAESAAELRQLADAVQQTIAHYRIS